MFLLVLHLQVEVWDQMELRVLVKVVNYALSRHLDQLWIICIVHEELGCITLSNDSVAANQVRSFLNKWPELDKLL